MPKINKCYFCGLKVTIKENTSGERSSDDWKAFRELQAKGIIPDGYPRNIYATVSSGETIKHREEYCAVDSKKWNKDEKCDYFQLFNSDMKLSDHISIHTTNQNAKLSHLLGFVALVISISILSVIIFVNFLK